MRVVAFLRGLARKLVPPGNRGSFEDGYEQPGRPPRLDVSAGPPAHDPGQTGI